MHKRLFFLTFFSLISTSLLASDLTITVNKFTVDNPGVDTTKKLADSVGDCIIKGNVYEATKEGKKPIVANVVASNIATQVETKSASDGSFELKNLPCDNDFDVVFDNKDAKYDLLKVRVKPLLEPNEEDYRINYESGALDFYVYGLHNGQKQKIDINSVFVQAFGVGAVESTEKYNGYLRFKVKHKSLVPGRSYAVAVSPKSTKYDRTVLYLTARNIDEDKPSKAFALNSGFRVTGRVVDYTNKPVANVSIKVGTYDITSGGDGSFIAFIPVTSATAKDINVALISDKYDTSNISITTSGQDVAGQVFDMGDMVLYLPTEDPVSNFKSSFSNNSGLFTVTGSGNTRSLFYLPTAFESLAVIAKAYRDSGLPTGAVKIEDLLLSHSYLMSQGRDVCLQTSVTQPCQKFTLTYKDIENVFQEVMGLNIEASAFSGGYQSFAKVNPPQKIQLLFSSKDFLAFYVEYLKKLHGKNDGMGVFLSEKTDPDFYTELFLNFRPLSEGVPLTELRKSLVYESLPVYRGMIEGAFNDGLVNDSNIPKVDHFGGLVLGCKKTGNCTPNKEETGGTTFATLQSSDTYIGTKPSLSNNQYLGLDNAKITFKGKSKALRGKSFTAQTKPNGSYDLKDIPAGTYSVYSEHELYEDQSDITFVVSNSVTNARTVLGDPGKKAEKGVAFTVALDTIFNYDIANIVEFKVAVPDNSIHVRSTSKEEALVLNNQHALIIENAVLNKSYYVRIYKNDGPLQVDTTLVLKATKALESESIEGDLDGKGSKEKEFKLKLQKAAGSSWPISFVKPNVIKLQAHNYSFVKSEEAGHAYIPDGEVLIFFKGTYVDKRNQNWKKNIKLGSHVYGRFVAENKKLAYLRNYTYYAEAIVKLKKMENPVIIAQPNWKSTYTLFNYKSLRKKTKKFEASQFVQTFYSKKNNLWFDYKYNKGKGFFVPQWTPEIWKRGDSQLQYKAQNGFFDGCPNFAGMKAYYPWEKGDKIISRQTNAFLKFAQTLGLSESKYNKLSGVLKWIGKDYTMAICQGAGQQYLKNVGSGLVKLATDVADTFKLLTEVPKLITQVGSILEILSKYYGLGKDYTTFYLQHCNKLAYQIEYTYKASCSQIKLTIFEFQKKIRLLLKEYSISNILTSVFFGKELVEILLDTSNHIEARAYLFGERLGEVAGYTFGAIIQTIVIARWSKGLGATNLASKISQFSKFENLHEFKTKLEKTSKVYSEKIGVQFKKIFNRISPKVVNFLKRASKTDSGDLFGGLLTSTPTSTRLKENLIKKGIKWVRSWQAHHVIPKSLWKHPAIRKLKLNIDSASNGIGLGKIHRGNHPEYTKAIERLLNRIDQLHLAGKRSIPDLQKGLLKSIDSLKTSLTKGTKLHEKDDLFVKKNWNNIVDKLLQGL